MNEPDARLAARVDSYAEVSARLSLLGDGELSRLLNAGDPAGHGIGGRKTILEVGGTPMFVKRVPVTDLELRPANLYSTANLFGLPLFYQYGVGSAGFGVWRELAAHIMATKWVLKGSYPGFPLMYHWRIQPDSVPAGFLDGFGGVDRAVEYWEGSMPIRKRLEAISTSSHSLILFLEYLPHTLGAWLSAHPGPSIYPWMNDALMGGVSFMSSHGLIHFDAHFDNILTDGELVYFADFGLALSKGFD